MSGYHHHAQRLLHAALISLSLWSQFAQAQTLPAATRLSSAQLAYGVASDSLINALRELVSMHFTQGQ